VAGGSVRHGGEEFDMKQQRRWMAVAVGGLLLAGCATGSSAEVVGSTGAVDDEVHEPVAADEVATTVAGSASGVRTPITGSNLAGVFTETFDGAPPAPLPWDPSNWDVLVHSRDESTWEELEPMHALHGTDCAGPPASHETSSYDGAVFQCKDHVMTAIQAGGYGLVYLTPAQLVDFSAGEAVVAWDMSTARTSFRDWVDVWVTPFEDNHALPFTSTNPDLQGPPKRAVHIEMDLTSNTFNGSVYSDFEEIELDVDGPSYETVFDPDAARRDRFELRISSDRIRFGMPTYDIWWIDQEIDDLGWTSGVVQLGHHSYNPTKDCDDCSANTWHWDNVTISPARPFAMLEGDVEWTEDLGQVELGGIVPEGSFLRFAGIGDLIEVSFDGGTTWAEATRQEHSEDEIKEEQFQSYWMPAPAGATSVLLRGENWWGGSWGVRNVAVWTP
jgi:hypothetical protein